MSEPGSNSNIKTAIGAGALLALLASNIYLFLQVHDIKADATKKAAEIAELRESSDSLATSARKRYQSLSEDLERRSRAAAQATTSARAEALHKLELSRKELEQQQQQSAQKMSQDLDSVRESATSKIAEVSTDVGNVKTEVSSTRSELQQTIADLKKVTGDLGVTSGYVATNSKELSALKRLGERNYFEFNISKSKQPQRVGDIQVQLKKTDPKRNRFTVEVLADDKRIEKKDKTANEPVQFYVAKARQPYEIVVNEVRKDQIVGYLATPKDMVQRGSASN